jgi:putative PIN family toxin of toxin-antitoxin system
VKRLVVDTNVLVSGFLSPGGPCGHIVRLLAAGEFHILHDARILGEYQRVLSQKEFKIPAAELALFLYQLVQDGELVSAHPLKASLKDPSDAPFIEVAIAGRADALVTGNGKHFPQSLLPGIPVLNPRQFILR